MPIILKQKVDNSILAVWKIEESLDKLTQIDSAQPYINDLNQFTSNSRKIEWLIVRLLLFDILKEHKTIGYNNSGRPLLTDNSHQISISHTKGYVAIYLSKYENIGIDIEYVTNRIERIASRVFSERELSFCHEENRLTQLLIMWCAKETLFKAFELKDVDFIEHLEIQPFEVSSKQGVLIGKELQSKDQKCLEISYIIANDFVLTYGHKKCPDEFNSAGHSK